LVLVATAASLAGVPAVAAATAPSTTPRATGANTAQGTTLVERFFDLLVEGDATGLEKLLSPAFQLQGADGGFLDKKDFLESPPEVEAYQLSNVRVTRAGTVIVVRYDVAATVTIDGVEQSRDPAPRLSVFTRGKKGWQMIAHANFNVPAQEPQQ
jgi:hypothetical protein